MKKIILIVVGIIVVAILGRGIWAYQQMKKDEARIATDTAPVTTATSGSAQKSTTAPNQDQLIKYTDASALFSLLYPNTWKMEKTQEGIRFFDKKTEAEWQKPKDPMGLGGYNGPTYNNTLDIGINTKPSAITDIEKELEYFGRIPGHSYKKEDTIVGGQKGYKISYSESIAKSVQYLIPITYNNLNVLLITSVVTRDNSQSWMDNGVSAVESITFDLTKISSFIQSEDFSQKDTNLKNSITSIRAAAELYRDTHPNFVGFCNAKESSKSLLDIKKDLGTQPFKCTDGTSVAVSAKLYSGEYYCADSTNFFGTISSLHTGILCK